MLMNGKEVNNLIIGGKRYAIAHDNLIGAKVKITQGTEILYTGEAYSSIGIFNRGTLTKSDNGYQLTTINQCLCIISKNKSEYWLQVPLTINNSDKTVVYVKAPCYVRLSDVELID